MWSSYAHTISRRPHTMTSSKENILRVTSPLCGEFTGHRWIPLTKASDAEHWCFRWSAPWINGWVNTREAGELRHHRAHYDVIVMRSECFHLKSSSWRTFRVSTTTSDWKFTGVSTKSTINNIPALVQIMAWCRPGDKPLYEPWWLDYRRIYASLVLNEITITYYLVHEIRQFQITEVTQFKY